MIFLAVRYLLERRRQTILTLLGVFFGTLAYVAVSGFFLGFQNYLVQQLVNNTAQIHIQARQDYLTPHLLDRAFYDGLFKYVFWVMPPAGVEGYIGVQSPQAWYSRLEQDPRVEAFSPQLTAPALFTVAKLSVSASFIGCNPAQQARVTSVSDYMTDGSFSDIAVGGNRIVMGAELMRKVGVGLQQTVFVSVGKGAAVPFKVVGRFETGNRYADLQAFGALTDVQRLNRTPNQVNEIAVRLRDFTQAAAIATNWSRIAPERVESWDQQNAGILSVFELQDALRFSMILAVLVVAGFGIYNVLNMTVTQKRRDIAILRSMGYDSFDVIMLFFSQGLIVGLAGAAAGLVCGYGVCRYLQTVEFTGGMAATRPTMLHISLAPAIYVQAALLALFAASLASILPARAAGRLTPIEIIRMGAE